MDNVLLERVKAITPKFNPSIANGLAVEHLMARDEITGTNRTMAYIDRLIHINRELFPAGLTYKGSQICSPLKHFEEITREYNSKRIANIAKNNTYLVKYQFEYTDPRTGKTEDLMPRYILLPYVRDGGIITLNGATYNIAPVLTDVGFSVLRGSIFIPFRRTKLTFNRTDHPFYMDGRRTTTYVIWSMIHHKMSERTRRDLDNRRYIESSLPHYFFCRFGVTETFRQWANAEVQVGWRKDFPASEYPRDQFTMYESLHLKGRHPTGELCLIVPKKYDNDLTRMLVAGFFYVVDTFPDRFRSPEYVDDVNLWRVILGHMVFGDFEHSGKVAENIDTHMRGLEISLDEMTREELRERYLYVSNIWELFHKILTDLSHHFYQTSTEEASMYNKRLTVLRYVMEEFNSAISMFGYDFQNRQDKEWTATELNEALKRLFKLSTAIRKLTSEHGELDTVSYPGDNKMFRITSMLVPQDKARRSHGYGKGLISDTSRLLHSSIAEVGQFNNQPKNNPDGRSRINPNVQTEVTGVIRRNPERAELIENTQKRINR
jgi:hypothetical protein